MSPAHRSQELWSVLFLQLNTPVVDRAPCRMWSSARPQGCAAERRTSARDATQDRTLLRRLNSL